jgi:hypothetical protein
MNRVFRGLVVARIASAVTEARAVAAVPHPGVKGQIREVLIRGLFRPLLPADVGVGHGQIVTSVDGRVSTEQDIVIYDRRLLPPILYEGSLGLFPLECTLATVEVKSRLTLEELRQADEKAGALFDFQYQSGVPASMLGSGSMPVERVMASLFALETDLSPNGTTEIQRYNALPGRHPEALRALCVVGRGYWFRWHDHWETTAQSFEFAEVAGFIAGIHGAYNRVASSRRAPSLADYLFQRDEMPSVIYQK